MEATNTSAAPPSSPLPKSVVDEIAHYRGAEKRFFDTWRRGVLIAGVQFFGAGTKDGFQAAKTKWDLVPNQKMITRAIGVMSPGEAKFIAAMYCFYNENTGKNLCRMAGLKTVLDLTGLDRDRQQVICDLIQNYCGW